jgi:hypothetical protein
MGGFSGNNSNPSSSLNSAGGAFNLTACAAGVAQNDCIQIAADGHAYTVKTSDYAAVANAGQIIAQTSVGVGANTCKRSAVLGSNGNLYVATYNSTTYGTTIYAYNSAGTLLNNVVVDNSTAGTVCRFQTLAILSNGNLVVFYQNSNTGKAAFAVYNPLLQPIPGASNTAIDGSVPSAYDVGQNVISLSGGGFAVFYESGNQNRFAIFTNAGGTTLGATPIGAAPNGNFLSLAQLSSGNIALTWGDTATWLAIYTAAGAQVGASTQLTAYVGTVPNALSVLNGYFAITGFNSNAAYGVWVFNNAGAQQGATYVLAQSGYTSLCYNLVNDGTQFWFSLLNASGLFLTEISTAGVDTPYTPYTSTLSGATDTCTMAYDPTGNSLVFDAGFSGASQQRFAVINLAYPNTLSTPWTLYGASNATNSGLQQSTLILPGDFAFISIHDASSGTDNLTFTVQKYANTAILGVGANAAAAGQAVSVQPNRVGGVASAFATNYIKGTPGKIFDHTSATIPGNKGAVMPYGVSLKGM